jgi:hypothetical protein
MPALRVRTSQTQTAPANGSHSSQVSTSVAVGAPNSTVSKRPPVLIPIADAMSGDLPAICALTGKPTTARWIRKLRHGNSISLPVNEVLLSTHVRRTRAARIVMLGFIIAWTLAIVAAIPAANAPTSSPLGPIAGCFFLLGLPLSIAGVVLLAKATGTIPLRWSVVVGDDGARYLRIGNPSAAFVDALKGDAQTSSDSPAFQRRAPRLPGLRTRVAMRWKLLVPYLATLLALVILSPHRLSSTEIPGAVAAAALLVAMGFVAVSLRWRIHIGSLFTLTPLNAVVIVLIAALASALGLIAALDPQHGSAGGEAIAGIGSAAFAIVAVVLVECLWTAIRRSSRSPRDQAE